MYNDNKELFFVTLKEINDNSIKIQFSPDAEGEISIVNFEKYYTDTVIFCDGNFEINNLFIYSNKLINDINPKKTSDKTSWQKFKKGLKKVASYPFSWYVDHIPKELIELF